MAFGYAKRIRGTKGSVEFECGDEGSMSTGGDLCDLHRTGPRYGTRNSTNSATAILDR